MHKEFIPSYLRFHIIGLILVIILFAASFINVSLNGIKTTQDLFQCIIGIIFFPVFIVISFKYIYIKKIEITDKIKVVRYIFRDEIIEFGDILDLRPPCLVTRNKNIYLINIVNKMDFIQIILDLENRGLIRTQKGERGLKAINNAWIFTAIGFLVLIILIILFQFIPYKLVGSSEDALITWVVLFCIALIFNRNKFR